MVHPNLEQWGQGLFDLRRLSTEAEHARTRERFLALYMIASKQTTATRWAAEIGRTKETVLSWVHQYNLAGPEAICYRRTGGRPPFLPKSKSNKSSTP